MDLLLVALLVLAVGGVALVAVGRVRGGLDAPPDPRPAPLDEPVRTPEDLDRARFAVGLRGYRMDQVDAVLDEARDVLAAREAEIERLREQVRLGAQRPVEARLATAEAPRGDGGSPS